MGKYKNLQDDVFSVFASAEWKAESLKVIPTNAINIGESREFLRADILASSTGINSKSVSGLLIVDIFTSAGNGPNRASLIADKLDSYLANQSIKTNGNNVTQFLGSTMTPRGRDPADKTLHKSVYSIPFNYFGVLT